ncbi:MAG: lamin tail domain-containing protein, partial [Thermoplasmata archaeon]|nr:lamin tail domain-containing protein [Thermoplasmata archaeon]
VWFCDGFFLDESIYFTYSADGGMTWGEKGRLSQDVLVDDTHGNGDPNDDNTAQKYPEIASGGYDVFVIWQDMRSQTSWQLYFAETIISSLQITEIRDSPGGQEAVEIFNYGGADWNLGGIVLRMDGHGDVDLSTLGTIPAGEYRTIGDSPSNDLSVDITLDDEGGFVALVKGVKHLDTVAYGQRGTTPDPLQGESVARYWTGLRYTFDWVRESAPTFGSHNDVPAVDRHPRLVLNEVLFNPLLPSDAFVEVMLNEGEDIDTNGYLLVCDSVHVLGSVVLTEQNPTFAVFQSSNPSFFSTITSSGDNIYLYDSSGQLLDMVGWNTSHTPDLSVARVPEGNGTYDGFDDESSMRAGWDFDMDPTPSVISIGPDQWKNGDAGEGVSYRLVVANRGASSDFVDITYTSEPNGWIVDLFQDDGVIPLTDSPADGDGIPDTGLVGPFMMKEIVVKVTIPSNPDTGAYENTTVYATSSNSPSLFGKALLVTRPYPSVAVNKSLSPGQIYVETAGPGHEMETTITLEVKGTGSSLFYDTPQDV